MKKNEEPFQMKGKGMAAAIAICFIAVVALVGAYTFSSYKREMKEQLAKAEEEQKEKEREVEEKEQSEAANTDRIVLPEQEGTAAYFSEEDTLLWPVDGNVIMNYNMDQSIYFATLDQYKYNPAVVISGQVGAEVKAAAAGTVSAVDTNAQTGTTVSIDMGNGYAAIYGQLKEVPVQPGEYVTENSVIGYVSEPTKYYSVEGPNLYFQLLKDGQPVNPMDHIAYE